MDQKYLDRVRVGSELERLAEWDKWVEEIPTIKFKPEWEVKIIPPFRGAVARFLVKKEEKEVSVYLDCYEILGCFDGPYWELYPYEGGTFRCAISEVDRLVEAIEASLNTDFK